MVSTISPVVYRKSDLGGNGWLVAATTYTLGSVAGGVFAGVLFGLVGALLALLLGEHRALFPLFVGLSAIAYAMHELSLVSLPYPQRQRQVPDRWRYKFHPYTTAGLFGLLLGAGFITFIPTATYYIVGLAVILYGSPVIGALIFTVYGAMRAALLWPFSWRNNESGMVEGLTYYMDLTKPVIRQINGFTLAVSGAYMISTYL
jgi:hypothetical protein